jgi:hypothetical protein
MQVLSQLSYNPTNRSTHRHDIGCHPDRFPGCSAGEFGAFSIAGFHHPGSLQIDGQRLLLPRQRVRGEGTTGVVSSPFCCV